MGRERRERQEKERREDRNKAKIRDIEKGRKNIERNRVRKR